MLESIADFLTSGPALGYYLFLFMVVALRSTAMYGVGRYGHYLAMKAKKPEGGFRLKIWNWVHAESTVNGMDLLRRRGWIAIPLCFLTVGVQSVITVSAGAIGMSVPMWIASAFAGWLAWAAIYSTIGFAVWGAAVSTAAGSPVGIAITVTVVVALLVYVVLVRPRKAAKAVIVED